MCVAIILMDSYIVNDFDEVFCHHPAGTPSSRAAKPGAVLDMVRA